MRSLLLYFSFVFNTKPRERNVSGMRSYEPKIMGKNLIGRPAVHYRLG